MELQDLERILPVTVRLNEDNENAEYCRWGQNCRPVKMPALYYCVTGVDEYTVRMSAQLNDPLGNVVCNPSTKHIYQIPREEVVIADRSNDCKGNVTLFL